MAFSIIVKEQAYTLEAFLNASFLDSYALRAQAFLNSWQNDGVFSFYTSGTTGLPKQLCFSKTQLFTSALNTLNALKLKGASEHILACLDLKFVGGAMMLVRALVLDCPISLFEPSKNILEIIAPNHPYTFASFVPLQLQNLDKRLTAFQHIQTVLIGGNSLMPALKKQLSVVSNRVFHTYGMTETLSNIALMQVGVDVGFWVIAPNIIRINEQQQIVIKTPILPDEFTSNDIGNWIDNTHFECLGRTDFVINSGGIKIHPEQIESIIGEQNLIPDNILFCLAKAPHPKWQEELVLVSNDINAKQYLGEIKNYLKERGLSYAKPQRFIYVNELPLNENGKILRKRLNEVIENEGL
jgi:O-succinylbenzoic acid--CoA ligase